MRVVASDELNAARLQEVANYGAAEEAVEFGNHEAGSRTFRMRDSLAQLRAIV
jgi:hypothetical protein